VNINTKEYWQQKYREGETGWNIGSIATPIKEYIDQLTEMSLKILIPGAGNAYEAEYLFEKGLSNVFVLDIASTPLDNLKKRYPYFPEFQLIEGDFFEHQGAYDLIIEQTFFCALTPDLREKYVAKMYDLLNPKGKLVGLLFNVEFGNNYPPFGGNKEEYTKLFETKFNFKTFEIAHNSIKPREDNELFIIFEKK
jgi:thiopurine S-methyltransferase